MASEAKKRKKKEKGEAETIFRLAGAIKNCFG
jgi:hypothetical protein